MTDARYWMLVIPYQHRSVLIQILDAGYLMLGYAVQARNDRCGVQAVAPALPSIEHPVSSIQISRSRGRRLNNTGTQHPASSIQHPDLSQ
ncbi:MAG: hypothetical protein QF473_08245 [Planctomycetota bacterium]|nr:hypothetical protein [Planctomycetota bacterium]